MQVFSADHYFTDRQTGEYRFDPSKLGVAHSRCLRGYINACRDADFASNWKRTNKHHVTLMRGIPGSGKSTWVAQNAHLLDIVVDNTNIGVLDLAPYVSIATSYGLQYEVVTVTADPLVAAQRCVHGVPLETLQRHAARLEQENLPSFWHQRRI